ncbi:unnamed protein product [Mytilus coruscus]|uniref:Protein kinase domain-containing protein n=1 Tax=Mytilus coruscus TaxID=42192 RepID=A0A6J8D5Z8_MYTCO|nr:unnamed protein product [Mytilus coruscus]
MPRGGKSGGSGRSGGGGGGLSGEGSTSSSSGATRTYVDNSYNRSAGRVGMDVGTAVISKGASYSSSSSSSSGSSSSSSSGSSSSCPKTYVDNAYNRGYGRVGMEHGTAVVSKDSRSSSSSSDVKTYVDNAYNRSQDRVGKSHGTAVVAKHATSTSSVDDQQSKCYKDNALNRKLERVGLPKGTAVAPKFATSTSSVDSPEVKCYKDNAFNRKHDRVGLVVGSRVISKKAPGSVTEKRYEDNALNRKHNRVGELLGSRPIRKSKQTLCLADLLKKVMDDPDEDHSFGSELDDEDECNICDRLYCIIGRENEVSNWQKEMQTTSQPCTSEELLTKYKGTMIVYEELLLGEQIGTGGFGQVYFAKWNGSIVAVKKLRIEQVSARRLKEFTDEIILSCNLSHPNVIRIIGACVVMPNLCIVMEYMQMSLFEALHIKNPEIKFTDIEKMKIIKQSCAGLQYLHEKSIAHCDMKTQNVLIDYSPKKSIFIKLTDFGLSMMKNATDTSMSENRKNVKNMGTPTYASPENLRGESLNFESLKMADMYSLSLICYEVVFEDEPFYNMSLTQLMKQVGEQGVTPDIPNEKPIDDNLLDLITSCWNKDATLRPSALKFAEKLSSIACIYNEL